MTVYLPESILAGGLNVLQHEYPAIEIGSYPFHEEGRFGSRLVLTGTDERELDIVAGRLDILLDELQGERSRRRKVRLPRWDMRAAIAGELTDIDEFSRSNDDL